jgi:hypothetical protein
VYASDPFLDALDKLYEDVWVSRGILVCLNEAEAEYYTTQLNRRAYSAHCLKQNTWVCNQEWEWDTALDWFQQCPNRILVVPLESMTATQPFPWENASWNLLLSVDVPSYRMDDVFKHITDAHKRGFGSEHTEFHQLWYLH